MRPGTDLRKLSIGELLALTRGVLHELKRRRVIRTTNAPTGDYAEWLTMLVTKGELEPNSSKSWDVTAQDGRRIQVKSRVVADPGNRGQRQLSAFRSWKFTDAVVILFDEEYRVRQATRFSKAHLERRARHNEWVNGDRVLATDELLDSGEDWTRKVRGAASRQDKQAPA